MKNNITIPCVDKCLFLSFDIKLNTFKCKMYDDTLEQSIKDDSDIVPLRHTSCIRDKYTVEIQHKIDDIRAVYDVFVYEMDTMFDILEQLNNKRTV